MRREWRRNLAAIMLGLVGSAAPHVALEGQEHLTVRTEMVLYGDNTEFRNPFREGETIFGAAVRPSLDVAVNSRVTVTLGAVGSYRFGSEDAFDLVRPVAAVTFHGRSSTFAIGTLPYPPKEMLPGPDRNGLHALLPPLQRETLLFERPYEAGLQWTVALPRVRHEAWLNWQRLNTSSHRERFDAGVTGELRAARDLSFPFELHVVHEGGQQFASGPVADSLAAALGVRVTRSLRDSVDASVDALAVASRYVPDRETPDRSRNGAGFFGRAALSSNGWRAHLLFWRGDDYVKVEGDPNYVSMRRDGTRYRGVRDYAETGVTGTFRAAPGVVLEASGRLHRVERHYEYSYRLLCLTSLNWRIR